jgi:hypothetical protein
MVAILTGSPLVAADARNFLPLLYLAAALVVGALVIYLVSCWRRSGATLGPSPSDELAQYRALYERGAISEEEYRKLRSVLGGEIRKTLELPRTAPPAAASDVAASPPAASTEGDPPTSGIRPA